ncbi:hypothetical protein AB0C51_22655 [Streptomyces pathocidini]|uniref:hypothetical protein n=1 Tax=Streptomyces pathocidini TaxID=1650571 RepID=UPI0033F8B4CA
MAQTDNGNTRRVTRRALRREVPSTVALLADERAFAAMRRYATFGFENHATYLREMEGLLRSLASQGVHTSVALFDPGEYAEFCEDTRLDPDLPDSRTRYTADVAGLGATVPYQGQSIELLVPALTGEAERQAALERATALLATAGNRPHRTENPGRAAYVRATRAVLRLIEAVGIGVHHLVCSVATGGDPLLAVLHAERDGDGLVHMAESEALVFCTVLAAGVATGSRAGIVIRTTAATGEGLDAVRGWALGDGWPQPLSAAQVFTAYCTDADTGEPVPPEPGVDYLPGIELPRPNGPEGGS